MNNPTTEPHPLEADVTLADGSVVRVTGLLAVKFRTNPDAVRKFVEKEMMEINDEH